MTMIATRVGVAHRPHRVTLQNPGPNVPDSDGGYTQAWTDLNPAAVSASIVPATTQNLERLAAGTVVTTATAIVTIPYHPQVTTATRVLFNGRSLSVTSVSNPEERNVELILLCVEAKPS